MSDELQVHLRDNVRMLGSILGDTIRSQVGEDDSADNTVEVPYPYADNTRIPMCMHVCMHTCMCVCMHVRMHACTYLCMYACLYVFACMPPTC